MESASSSESSDSSYESKSDGKGGRVRVKKEKKGILYNNKKFKCSFNHIISLIHRNQKQFYKFN